MQTLELLNVADQMSHVVSYSQMHNCGWQIMFHRGRVDRGPKGISAIYGTAVHAGIETAAGSRSLALAVQTALVTWRQELDRHERARGVRWMDPPRIRKDGQPYRGDEGKLNNRQVAEAGIRAQVTAWMEQFGHLRIVKEEIEREVRLDLGGGWALTCYLDMPTAEGGLLDVKTAKEPWDERRKLSAQLQAQVYTPAFQAQYGKPPAYFAYHVLPRGTNVVQVVEVEYDPARLAVVYDHMLPALIRQIENRAYLPNTGGWWCSSDYCDWHAVCPLGAGGEPAGEVPVDPSELLQLQPDAAPVPVGVGDNGRMAEQIL